jgi:hypothetical protein
MYGQEYGAILPNQQPSPIETYQRLKAANDARALQNAKYLKDTLDFNQFATGLPEYDPVIHQTISDAMKDLSQKAINPAYSQAQLLLDANNYTQKLSDYSTKARLIDQQLQALRAEQAKNKYVNADNWYKYAKLAAFHDGNGAVRNINDVDPNKNYWDEALHNHADDIINGDGGIGDYIKASDKKPITTQIQKVNNGIKTTSKYAGEIYPAFNTTIKDPKTGVVTGIGLKSQTIKDAQGNDINIADNDTYNLVTSDKYRNAALNKVVRAQGIDPNSELGEVAKRKALYDYLQTKGVGYLNHTGDDVDDSAYWRQQNMRDRQDESERFRLMLKSMNNGNGTKADTQFNDIYGELQGLKGKYNNAGIPLNNLSPQAQTSLLNYANTSYGQVPSGETDSQGNPKLRKLNAKDVWVRPNDDGTFSLMRFQVKNNQHPYDEEIAPLDFKSTNTLKGINSSVKERQAVYHAGQPENSIPTYSAAELKKAGWSDDQINKAQKAGKIKVQ